MENRLGVGDRSAFLGSALPLPHPHQGCPPTPLHPSLTSQSLQCQVWTLSTQGTPLEAKRPPPRARGGEVRVQLPPRWPPLWSPAPPAPPPPPSPLLQRGRGDVEARGLMSPKSLGFQPKHYHAAVAASRPPSDRRELKHPALLGTGGLPVLAGGSDTGQHAAQSGHSEVAA